MLFKNQSCKIIKQEQCGILETLWLDSALPHFSLFGNLSFFFSRWWVLNEKISSSQLLLAPSLKQFFFLTLQFLLTLAIPGSVLISQSSETRSCLFLLFTVLLPHLSPPGLFFVSTAQLPPPRLEGYGGPTFPGFRLLFRASYLDHCNTSQFASTPICQSSHLIHPCQIDLPKAQFWTDCFPTQKLSMPSNSPRERWDQF